MKKFLIVLMITVVSVCAVFARPASDSDINTRHYKFGYAAAPPKNSLFLDAIEDAIREEVEKRGDTLVAVEAQNNAQAQLSLIDDLIAQGIDVLLLSPANAAGIKPALEACQKAGIPVVNFNSEVSDTDLVASIIVSDNYYAGILVARDMMNKLPRNSKISLLVSPTSADAIKRISGFKDTANGYFNIISELPGRGDPATSLELTLGALQENPDLAGFFSINDPSALACGQAVVSQNRNGVLVYGVDGNPDGKKGIAEGILEGTAAHSPIAIGKKTIEIAYKILAGETVEKNITVPVLLIDQGNLARYGVDGWQ